MFLDISYNFFSFSNPNTGQVQKLQDKKVTSFLDNYKFSECWVNQNNDEFNVKWITEKRLNYYHDNLISLKAVLLNIVVIVIVGIFLLFFKPQNLVIPFLPFNIPE
jgi:hypothetical protein